MRIPGTVHLYAPSPAGGRGSLQQHHPYTGRTRHQPSRHRPAKKRPDDAVEAKAKAMGTRLLTVLEPDNAAYCVN